MCAIKKTLIAVKYLYTEQASKAFNNNSTISKDKYIIWQRILYVTLDKSTWNNVRRLFPLTSLQYLIDDGHFFIFLILSLSAVDRIVKIAMEKERRIATILTWYPTKSEKKETISYSCCRLMTDETPSKIMAGTTEIAKHSHIRFRLQRQSVMGMSRYFTKSPFQHKSRPLFSQKSFQR